MPTLTTDQQVMLLDIINEEFGSHLEFDEFTDVLLSLFEDIPGFETISQSKANHLIKLLWSKYHGQVAEEN